MKYERYILAVLFLLLLTGALTVPLSYLSNFVYNLFDKLFYLIFN